MLRKQQLGVLQKQLPRRDGDSPVVEGCQEYERRLSPTSAAMNVD